MLCLKCEGQHLTVDTCEKVASGFINANVVHFDFCERWAGTVKTAQFTQRRNGKLVTYSVMIDELAGTAAMPNEVEAGDLLISAFGVDPDTGMRITTTIITIKVEPSGYTEDGETPIPPTPDLYQQLVRMVVNTAGSPVIGDNGNWYLDNIDTGVKADWSAEQENAKASASAAAESEKTANESAERAEQAMQTAEKNQAELVEKVNKTAVDLLTKAPAIECEASGALVSVTDAAAQPAVQLISHIKPVQEGEGDPSPDNVRPISGWDSVGVNRTRKNLLPINNVNTNQSETGQVTVCNVTPGSYTLSADITKYSDDTATNTRIGLTVLYTDGTTAHYQSDVDTNNLERDGISRKKIVSFTTNKNKTVKKIMIWLLDRTAATVRNAKAENAQLEQGLTATAYEPYSGQTLTADLPETVYGGALDWGTGVLTVDTVCREYDGSEDESWQTGGTVISGQARFIIKLGDVLPNSDPANTAFLLSSMYLSVSPNDTYTNVMGAAVEHERLDVYDPNCATMSLTEWRAWLAQHPVQIAYKLATPYTIQLTARQLSTLKGTNNVWSNTGDTSLVYVADTKTYIDNKIAAIATAIVNG